MDKARRDKLKYYAQRGLSEAQSVRGEVLVELITDLEMAEELIRESDIVLEKAMNALSAYDEARMPTLAQRLQTAERQIEIQANCRKAEQNHIAELEENLRIAREALEFYFHVDCKGFMEDSAETSREALEAIGGEE